MRRCRRRGRCQWRWQWCAHRPVGVDERRRGNGQQSGVSAKRQQVGKLHVTFRVVRLDVPVSLPVSLRALQCTPSRRRCHWWHCQCGRPPGPAAAHATLAVALAQHAISEVSGVDRDGVSKSEFVHTKWHVGSRCSATAAHTRRRSRVGASGPQLDTPASGTCQWWFPTANTAVTLAA